MASAKAANTPANATSTVLKPYHPHPASCKPVFFRSFQVRGIELKPLLFNVAHRGLYWRRRLFSFQLRLAHPFLELSARRLRFIQLSSFGLEQSVFSPEEFGGSED